MPEVIRTNIPTSVNSVARLANYACRLFYDLYRTEKYKASTGLIPVIQVQENVTDGNNDLVDVFIIVIKKDPDAISNADNVKPWVYASEWANVTAIPSSYLA